VEPGDQVTLYSKGQQYLYVVQNRMMLDEAGVSAHQQAANARYIAPTNEEVVTLVTCWPPTGPEKFSQRIIVRAVPYRADTNQNEEPPNSADTWHPR
jgi:sortase (surface protein transpeptidase)